MSVQLEDYAVEGSTFPIEVTFKDSNDQEVTPTIATWTLKDADGNIINSRENVPISPLASTVIIVLQGDDLALPLGRDRKRFLTIDGLYDASYGNDLSLKVECDFWVVNQKAGTPSIIATKGASDANSYATIDEANDYLNAIFGFESWASISWETKERLLIAATRDIDKFTLLYDSADDTQALNFPLDHTDDGFDKAKKACIMQAYYLSENLDAIKEAQTGVLQGIKNDSLKGISKEVTGFNPIRKYAPEMLRLLSGFIDLDFMAYRG